MICDCAKRSPALNLPVLHRSSRLLVANNLDDHSPALVCLGPRRLLMARILRDLKTDARVMARSVLVSFGGRDQDAILARSVITVSGEGIWTTPDLTAGVEGREPIRIGNRKGRLGARSVHCKATGLASYTMTANLSNWRESPYNTWSFQHVDEIIPTHPIPHAPSSTPSAFKPNIHQFPLFKVSLPSTPDLDLPAFLTHTSTDGLVVISKGELIFEHYANGNDASTRHILMSMSKSIVGLICGILSDRGVLDLSLPVSHYIPSAAPALADFTLRECLDMRSGLALPDSTPAYRAAAGWTPSVSSDSDAPSAPRTLLQLIERFDGPVRPRPAGFEYASLNTDMLGVVLERATGRRFADLVSELLWKPLGAECPAYVTVDAAETARAAGGICASVRDVARLGQLVLEGGRDVVPRAWIEDMLSGGDEAVFAAGAWARMFVGLPGWKAPAYRSCWTTDCAGGRLLALGIHGQMLLVDREHGMALAKTSSQAEPVGPMELRATILAMEEFRKGLKV
nr:6-aminohexanoate-dimer hydrolase [Quercus suber]